MGEPPSTLVLRVTPRSGVPGIGPWRDGVLEVRVAQQPIDGAATTAALDAVAAVLGVPRSAVRLRGGARSRHKRVAVSGLTADQVAALLARLGGAPD